MRKDNVEFCYKNAKLECSCEHYFRSTSVIFTPLVLLKTLKPLGRYFTRVIQAIPLFYEWGIFICFSNYISN